MAVKQKKNFFDRLPYFVHILFVILCAFSLVLNGYFLITSYRRNIVISVPDGDSLELRDGRRIRLLGLDAPERGMCMGSEAGNYLRSLALGHHVSLKNTATDDYGRTLANVFIDDITARFIRNKSDFFLNQSVIFAGFARYKSAGTLYNEVLKAAQDSAKQKLIGIWSPACRSKQPVGDCVIKGNIRAGKKTYLLPTCTNYDQTIIDTSYGDAWFCLESEALKAGFFKSPTCF